MMFELKICGLSTPPSLAAARDGGASHLGFIFFEKSPRNVTPQLAAELAAQAGSCLTVAVTVDASDDFLDDIVAVMAPKMLQLHGHESIQRVANVKARYGLPVIKCFSIRSEADLANVSLYENVADRLLLDAKPPKGSDLPGGNGVSFDWSLVETLQSKLPVWLSGGLNIENVESALEVVRSGRNAFAGLDVSSGVESAPGVKDIIKLKEFLAASAAD
ncbi:MAG: phosphoribosylanthranilate isomerase [Hyphomicrobiales bacterium]|nr:MAG: phosphoribosylanthranilate isomerase [Hyphomicrobiales bacterium]